MASTLAVSGAFAVGPAETNELTIGFIRLTDMAPLAIAYEKGFFEDEGLDVFLEPQANWNQLLDGVAGGLLEAAHMLAGQPLAVRVGYVEAAGQIVAPISLDLNGNAITVSNEVWKAMSDNIARGEDGKPVHPISADALKPIVEEYKSRGEPFKLGMVFSVSPHNYELRYWLAAGGIHPGLYDPTKRDAKSKVGWIDGDVKIYVTPPPQMPSLLDRGGIYGYSVGEPWNQQAVSSGVGVPVITDHDIWKYNPEKVFGMNVEFVAENPNTTVRVVRALLRAAKWLDSGENANRMEAVEILSRPEYVDTAPEIIASSMTGTFEYEKGDTRPAPDFNVFFRQFATYPFYSDGVWTLTQMRRWGQISGPKPDAWYNEVVKDVYRPDIYAVAAKELIAEGQMNADEFPDLDAESGFRPPTAEFIDGTEFDGRQPNHYLQQFTIGLKE